MPGSGDPRAGSGDGGIFRPSRQPQRPASVVSSRMTDIMSDDGDEAKVQRSVGSRPRTTDRPETAHTAASSKTAGHKVFAGLGARRGGSVSSTANAYVGRAPTLTTRSHVPSLTSNAFYRPMSSQKLQAQRGGPLRPVAVTQPPPQPPLADVDDGATDKEGSVMGRGTASPRLEAHDRSGSRDVPSRSTEMTEQENFDRVTGNTSPSQGYYPAGSMSDSVRPLQGRPDARHLSVNVDGSLQDPGVLPSPMRSSRSFRSSFLLPGKGDQGQASRNRSTEGAEKLWSATSSPRLRAVDSRGRPISQPPAPAKATQTKSAGRVHQYFDGNTVFCLGGRWQNAKHRPINVATGLFVAVPCVLFYVFEAPWLWRNISPAIPIAFAYLSYVCISSFVHASVSDPGILPRNLHRFPPVSDDDDPLRVGPPTNDWTLTKSAEAGAAAMEVPVKHCRTCDIWRPPRAHHCRLCDNCVDTHDHHCVWLNNCVGKRNYRYFFAFVASATMLAAYLVAASLAQILVYMTRQGVTFGEAVGRFRVPFALVVVGFVGFLYPAALMGYHLFLMARGETTREYINSHKFPKRERYRAFSQGGVLKNLVAVLCRPRAPAAYRFKGKHRYGDQRLRTERKRRPQRDSQGLEMDAVQPAFEGPVSLRGQGRP